MTIIQAQELIESVHYTPGLKNRFRKGLSIMEKYYDDIEPIAEHDDIWVNQQGDDLHIEEWTEPDISDMARCGWDLDLDIESWHYNASA